MAKRVDENQAEVVAALRHIGCSVADIHAAGHGIPDIVVGYRGRNWLMEIKAAGGRMTADERQWHKTWRGQKAVVWTAQQAVDLVTEEADE